MKNMKPREYFPLGKAHGDAFCNRHTETKWLIDNIQACKHSLLIAPRRYGKSSLAEKAIAASGLAMVGLNFNICTDEYDVEALIRQGVGQLISRSLGPMDKIINSIKNYVGHLTPTLRFGPEYAQLELANNQQEQTTASGNIEEALQLMEKMLAEKKQRAVMLFDEFQIVGLIAKGSGVEAAIRNVAQETKHLSFLFSGSSRALLQAMFEDENRPLYKLCRKLHLQRIEPTHYQKHINQAANLAWGADLEAKNFERIMQLSERHPYYVNYLCDVVWTESTAPPTVNDIDRCWNIILEEEHSDANAEVMNLAMGQKKILKYIANYSGDGLMSANAIKTIGMAMSSIAGAIAGLIEKDMIEKRNESYIIVNPVIHYLLKSKN